MKAPRAIALCQCFLGALEFQGGKWQKAEAALRESIRLYREIGAASGEALAWQRLGVLQTAQGRLDEGMQSLDEGLIVAEHAVMRAHCQTRLYASLLRNRLNAGDLEAADRAMVLGLAMGQRHGHCATCDALLLQAATSLQIQQNHLDQAEVLCQRLEQASQEYASQMWVAMASQSRAELDAARGDTNKAISGYTHAQEAYAAAGYEYEVARCLLAQAELHAHAATPEGKAHAIQLSRQAHEILTQLGVEPG